MKILALDTSTDACTVAIWQGGSVLERSELGKRHSERILSMVQEVLSESGLALRQLDAVAFGRGPGSFTGLRTAAGVTQGLAFGADLPVVAVSSLAALAQGQEGTKVLTAFDARMQQVYWASYQRNDQGLMELIGPEIVIAPHHVPYPDTSGWLGVGSGWDQYSDLLLERLGDRVAEWKREIYPRAADVAALGAAAFRAGLAVPAEQALPVYIRDEVAVKQAKS